MAELAEPVSGREGAAAPGRAMRKKFRALYGGEPAGWVRAPGRAELLGTDTDDHLGYVMTMAIHLDTWIAFRPSGSRPGAPALDEHATRPWTTGSGEEPTEPNGSWDRYVSGVSRVLRAAGARPERGGRGGPPHRSDRRGPELLGLAPGGGLPHAPGGGRVQRWTRKETALACQQAENQDAGVNCGILDQYSSCFGLKGTALLLDCRSLTHVEVRIPADIRIVICDTNFPRTLAGSEYAKRRQECDEGTRLLAAQDPSIRTLRDVNTPLFERLKGALPEVLRKRCQFVFEENQRVVAFMAAVVRERPGGHAAPVRGLVLRGAGPVREDGARHGADVRGHDRAPRGDRRPAVRRRVRRLHAGLRARRTGFPSFAGQVRGQYKEKTGIEATIHVTEPSAGAGALEA